MPSVVSDTLPDAAPDAAPDASPEDDLPPGPGLGDRANASSLPSDLDAEEPSFERLNSSSWNLDPCAARPSRGGERSDAGVAVLSTLRDVTGVEGSSVEGVCERRVGGGRGGAVSERVVERMGGGADALWSRRVRFAGEGGGGTDLRRAGAGEVAVELMRARRAQDGRGGRSRRGRGRAQAESTRACAGG